MTIPSPDAALVALTDALYGIPQSRGVPLPIALAPACMAPTMGAALVMLTLPGIGQWMFVPPWVLVVLVFGKRGHAQTVRYRRDARAWTPEKARDYRAQALHQREAGLGQRSLALALTCALWVLVAVSLSIRDAGAIPFALNGAAYAVLATTATAMLYAQCAMPRDPDLRDRVGVPQAA